MRRYGRFMGERSVRSPTDDGWSPGGDQPLLVSACLLGVACNHRGRASPSEEVKALSRDRRLIPICPESVGGLPTPREEAALGPDGRVRTASGEDVTSSYEAGAHHTVALAAATGAAGAVLKARSPSCGCHEIYDGTFTHTRVEGQGVTAKALQEAGVRVWSEEDVAKGEGPEPT